MNNKVLELHFKNYADYKRAKNFFDEYSAYLYHRYDERFNSLLFEVDDQDDADGLEAILNEELIQNGFESFWFMVSRY